MSIQDVINRARREPPYCPPNLKVLGPYICRVANAVDWDRRSLERELGFEIPDEFVALWLECGGMSLCEEATCQQGGMVVLSPHEVVAQNRSYRQERSEDARPGDLIFARFLGDLRLGLIRCDRSLDDYGAIMIVAEMDERSDWYMPAQSLEKFLDRYIDTHGDDYWDVHYEEILAERAKRQRV